MRWALTGVIAAGRWQRYGFKLRSNRALLAALVSLIRPGHGRATQLGLWAFLLSLVSLAK